MNEFYTADLHFGHSKVAEIRGFDTTTAHDLHVLGSLYNTLSDGDRLFILGDLTGGHKEAEEDALNKLRGLAWDKNLELHLISGNHDVVHPMHRHSEKAYARFIKVFDSVDSMGSFRHNKKKIILSHFPFDTDRGFVRYPEYRLADAGTPVVHGHTHSAEKVSFSQKGTLQVCVSLDAWNFKPASKPELADLISGQDWPQVDFGETFR